MKFKTKSFFVKTFFVLFTLLILTSCMFANNKTEKVYAVSSIDDLKGNITYEYIITNYNVNMVVNENNTYNIVENITAYFNVAGKHGIYRYIPIYNKILRADNSTDEYMAKIYNVKCNKNYSTETSGNYLTLVIGDEDTTFSSGTSVNYVISYTFDAGVDKLKNEDEFYFNLIGTGWDAPIGNVSFSVQLPKSFDTTKIGITHGEYGSSNTSDIHYSVTGTTITGYFNGILSKYEGLTARITFEEGYFNRQQKTTIYQSTSLVIPIIVTILLLILWFTHAKNKPVVEEITFYPPNKWNSFELGYYYRGRTDTKDFTSMIIYLANKGYIKIVETENSTSTRIEKVKDYDGSNTFEADFMNNLFMSGNSISTSTPSLKFQTFVDSTKRTMNKIANRAKLNNLNIGLVVFAVVSYIAMLFLAFGMPFMEYKMYGAIIPVIFVIVFSSLWFLAGVGQNSLPNKVAKIALSIILILVSIFVPILVLKSFHLDLIFKQEPLYISSSILNIIGAICALIIAMHSKRRTEYGDKYYGKVLGFKRFLNTAEKDKLEMLVAQTPTYFYDILPYTYVLGVSDKWIKKFESISMVQPDWYVSPHPFVMHHFASTCNHMSHSFSHSITPHSSGSSGGGGGFSGGGGGGGGGGSW